MEGETSKSFPLGPQGAEMDHKIKLGILLPTMKQERADCLRFFALINLGLIESLVNGSIGASEAVERFYFAENCLFVRKDLKDRTADRIMSHGV